jgi:hypothetical protein
MNEAPKPGRKNSSPTPAPEKSDTPPPLVMVMWEDAKTVDEDGAWKHNKNHTYKPHIVYSVGYLLLDVPEGIHITQAWHPEYVGAPDQIPRGMIRCVIPLTRDLSKPNRRKNGNGSG